MKLAIDFDGVIHDYKNPIQGRRMGEPIYGAKDALLTLQNQGHELTIYSVRGGSESGKKSISDFMDYYGIPYDSITNIKEKSDYYIDDNAIRFDNWNKTLKEIK